MTSILTVPTKQSPFPYASTGIVAYTSKAEINFDDAATSTTLVTGASTLTEEDDIVQQIGKEAGLLGESAKVDLGLCLHLSRNF